MWSVEQVSGPMALMENTETTERRVVPLLRLPQRPKEGDCFRETPEGFVFDPKETEARRKKNADKMNELFD